MPIKSKAQRRKFAELLVKGDISPETFEKWNRQAGSAELPERLHPKQQQRKKSAAKRKKRKTAGTKTAAKKKGRARKRR